MWEKKIELCHATAFFFPFFFFSYFGPGMCCGTRLAHEPPAFFSSIKASSSLSYGDGEQITIAPPFAPPTSQI